MVDRVLAPRHGADRVQRAAGDAAEPASSSVAVVQAMMAAGGNLAMVQLAAEGGGREGGAGSAHAVAARGVSGAGAALPHLGAVQRAFGRHDIGGVQAYTGGAAREASEQLGARAYATGDRVAFAEAPDLHTAAHEAAHVVQQHAGVQLKGGLGQVGDAYERHADAVADRVVAGQSAEGLLDRMAGGGGRERGGHPGVQRSAIGAQVQRDEKQDARDLETRDGGHSLDRHGPELGRADLIRRLSTGYAPDGVFSPAPGYSTKFSSYAEYLATRKTVQQQIQVQAKHTLRALQPTWDAYVAVCREFDASDPGPGRVPIIVRRTTARTALENAVAQKGGRNQYNQFNLGVRFVNDFANPTAAVRLCGNYKVGLNHGRSIGMGFEGTNPLQLDDPRHNGEEFTSYRNFVELDEIKKTFSTVEIAAEVTLSGQIDTSSFAFAQHFPAPAAQAGICSN